ncbi:UPF0481 protein At3g47200 [Linum perenne]
MEASSSIVARSAEIEHMQESAFEDEIESVQDDGFAIDVADALNQRRVFGESSSGLLHRAQTQHSPWNQTRYTVGTESLSIQNPPLNQTQYEIIDMRSLRHTSGMLQNNVTRLTMFRIPQSMHQVNPLAYTPQFVSIGPFHHHGNFNTLAMEDHKRVFMLHLLEQTSAPDNTLHMCQEAVYGVIGDVLACYSTKIEFSWELLTNIILVDSCFLLQVFFLNSNFEPSDVHLDDKYKQMLNSGIRRDLALLENQLPFFVLEKLFSIFMRSLVNPLPNNITLSELAFNVFKSDLNIQGSLTEPPADQHYKHLLDLIAKCAHPSFSHPQKPFPHPLLWNSQSVHLRNAKKLREVGIEFEAAGESTLLELKFNNGVFKIPPLVINECTESLLRNLVAFEYSSNDPAYPHEYFASYVFLMERLVSSKEDLDLLESKGILINQLGGRDDATKIFYNISKNFVLKKFYFGELCCTVEAYCCSKRHRYLRDLQRHYLKNPWTTLSVFAASILLVLTAIQTYYTYIGYVHRQ